MAQALLLQRPYRVRHATDAVGRPLLLCKVGGELDRALSEGDDHAVVLSVACHRRVWVAGWAAALSGVDARAAAVEFAELNPLSDLLDVGQAFRLYRVDVAEVRLEDPSGAMIDVDVDSYAAASPLPVGNGPVM